MVKSFCNYLPFWVMVSASASSLSRDSPPEEMFLCRLSVENWFLNNRNLWGKFLSRLFKLFFGVRACAHSSTELSHDQYGGSPNAHLGWLHLARFFSTNRIRGFLAFAPRGGLPQTGFSPSLFCTQRGNYFYSSLDNFRCSWPFMVIVFRFKLILQE